MTRILIKLCSNKTWSTSTRNDSDTTKIWQERPWCTNLIWKCLRFAISWFFGGKSELQIMFDANCTPGIYQFQGKDFEFPDLTSVLCPNCKEDHLKRHGFYSRYLICKDFEGEIFIRRYCCHKCWRTVSLLPSFCHPKRSYGLLVIFKALFEFYTGTNIVSLALKNFLSSTGVKVSRQLLLHYRRRIEKNISDLVAAISAIRSVRPPPASETAGIKESVRQFLLDILYPQDDSLKIFEQSRITYLTPYAI